MRKHKTELELFQDALGKIKINEAAIPLHNGKIVEDADTYSKVEKLLACPEMEQSHKFLYDIDFDQLDDDTVKKVNDLYDLAIEQGLLENSNQDEIEATSNVTEEPEEVSSPGEVSEIVPSVKNVINCYTCFYSAIKNGEIKTGECYSNSPTPEQAKVDAISKLTKIGFTDINIIAVETGDTDLANCDPLAHTISTSEPISQETSTNEPITEDMEEIEEAEICPKCHNRTLIADPHSGNMKCSRCHYWSKTGGLDKRLFLYKSKNESEDEESEETPSDETEKEETSTKDLSHQEKVELFTKFFKTFKDLLIKSKKTSYKNMTIEEKANFLKSLADIWKNEKYDPRDFMTPANFEKLENMEVKIK